MATDDSSMDAMAQSLVDIVRTIKAGKASYTSTLDVLMPESEHSTKQHYGAGEGSENNDTAMKEEPLTSTVMDKGNMESIDEGDEEDSAGEEGGRSGPVVEHDAKEPVPTAAKKKKKNKKKKPKSRRGLVLLLTTG